MVPEPQAVLESIRQPARLMGRATPGPRFGGGPPAGIGGVNDRGQQSCPVSNLTGTPTWAWTNTTRPAVPPRSRRLTFPSHVEGPVPGKRSSVQSPAGRPHQAAGTQGSAVTAPVYEPAPGSPALLIWPVNTVTGTERSASSVAAPQQAGFSHQQLAAPKMLPPACRRRPPGSEPCRPPA